MPTYRIVASLFVAIVSTIFPLIAAGSAQDGSPGTLAVFDPSDSTSRLVLYEAAPGTSAETMRAKVEAEAMAAGRTAVWVPFRKTALDQALQRLADESVPLKGIVFHGTSMKFTDAENVEVLLDVTLSRSSQAELLVNAANDILSRLPVGQKIQLGARPGNVKILSPDPDVVLKAINEDLAKPELRLAGCRILAVTFTEQEDARSSLLEGTLAFKFQSEAVVNTVQGTLTRLGFEDWTEVRPIDAGFKIQPPDMNLYLKQLQQALRENDSTKNIPIIFVSAVSRNERKIFRGFTEGSIDLLPKPIDMDDARTKVELFEQIYFLRKQVAMPESSRV